MNNQLDKVIAVPANYLDGRQERRALRALKRRGWTLLHRRVWRRFVLFYLTKNERSA